jgi:hypothetical protein
VKTFNQFIAEAEEARESKDLVLGKQHSYGKNLKSALVHMFETTKMYCEENNINFDTSRFDFSISMSNSKNINNFIDIAAGEFKEPKEPKTSKASKEPKTDKTEKIPTKEK